MTDQPDLEHIFGKTRGYCEHCRTNTDHVCQRCQAREAAAAEPRAVTVGDAFDAKLWLTGTLKLGYYKFTSIEETDEGIFNLTTEGGNTLHKYTDDWLDYTPPVAETPDLAAENARLRDENEELKRRLERVETLAYSRSPLHNPESWKLLEKIEDAASGIVADTDA
jgi:hypothetical protein